MNCEKLKSLLADYLDEEAADKLCREVERHLKECGPCEVEIDKIKKTVLIYRSDNGYERLSSGARERLFMTLSYEYRQSRRSTPR